MFSNITDFAKKLNMTDTFNTSNFDIGAGLITEQSNDIFTDSTYADL